MKKDAARLLANYRRIYNDFQKMNPEDKEYDLAKRYIEAMNMYFGKLDDAELPETNFLEKSGLTTNQLKQLYADVLKLAYLSGEYKSSLDMIEVIKEKYGINLSVSRFTLLKECSVEFFSSVLPE